VNPPTPIAAEDLLGEVATVRRLARALVRREDLAHDVVQDVALAALQQPHAPQRLGAWFAAVTRRLASKARRAELDRARREGKAAPPEHDDGGLRVTERLCLHRRLADAVLGLPEPYRTAVTLRFFDDLPPREIAERTDTPVATVQIRIHRGLAKLRSQLDTDRDGLKSWSGILAPSTVRATPLPSMTT
jgi:RNA polymerase sigma-70 factor (ECF subfamily)